MAHKRVCDSEMELADIKIPDQQTKGNITTCGTIKIAITGQLDLCEECICEKIEEYLLARHPVHHSDITHIDDNEYEDCYCL